MLPRLIGGLVGFAAFLVYFSLVGTTPVWETFIGVAVTIGAGLWAYWQADRWLRRRDGDRP